ncbi:MAG: Gfo/Idh/MocA family oxidoreductase [Isosphaeraceae bacterium]|nr:Gfo/Idh/MocA family oxidoreductase [Isosphaeraceae bacterium]
MANQAALRWGIMGCARISRRGLIPGIRESTSGTLAAIASRSLATAREWAAEFSIPRAHGSYAELLGDPEIDAVYIPLPNELHLPMVLDAAAAGKHILCEKPLALDTSEAERMIEACKTAGVVLMEAFMWRHQPRTHAIRYAIDSGEIGDLILIRSSFSFSIDPSDWRLDPARGGGALWDVGCYGVSTARLFAGAEPTTVDARARFGPTGTDASLVATLSFPRGILAVIDCSFEQPFRCSYELVGTKGSIEVPDAYLPPEKPLALITTESGVETREFEGRNQYAAMVDAFARAVAEGGELSAPSETGLEQMRTLDAILASARSNR